MIVKKAIALLLGLILVCASISGCTDKKEATSQTGEIVSEALEYPIKTDATLTYWVPFDVTTLNSGSDLGDTELYKELEKRTGVKIEFIHPVAGQETEQFNLRVASGDLPDMMTFNFLTSFPGGPDKAIDTDVITRLNDLIPIYAPNLSAVLEKDQELDKMIKTDSNNYYVFPFVRNDDYLTIYMGPMLRADWLEELGLSVPETIDEWYNVLKAFKNEKKAQAPLSIQTFLNTVRTTSAFVGAYGVKDDFYVEDGKVVFGPIEPGYKEYLATMNKWYKEGLLDNDFATTERSSLNAKLLSDQTGATVGWTGGTMGTFLDTMKEENPKADLVATPYPVLKKGSTPKFGHNTPRFTGATSVAISAKSKHKEIAAKWLDYGYSEEGHMLLNFGIEGISYEMADGYPKYTEFITNNPDGLAMSSIMPQYMTSTYGGPMLQDRRYMEQYSKYDQQKNALDVWAKTTEKDYLFPAVTRTADEDRTYSSIMNDINTYREEMILKFILGQEPISNFDKYVEVIKSMGIDEAIKINQEALKRYNAR